MAIRSFASNAAVTATTNLLITGIGFMTSILAARILGVQGRGELAAIQLWPTIFATIAMLGFSDSLVYWSSRDQANTTHYIGTAVPFTLLVAFMFAAAGYVAMPHLLNGQSAEIVSTARLCLVMAPIFAISALPYHALLGKEDFVSWNIVRTTPNIAWLIVLAIAIMHQVTSARTLALGYLASLLLIGLANGYFVMRRIPGSYAPRARDLKSLLKFGLPSLLTTGPNLLAARADQMILVAFFSPSTLGLFVVANGWAGAVTPLLSSIAAVTFPRIASADDIGSRNTSIASAVRMSIVAASIAIVPVALFAPIMIPILFGSDFTDAVTTSILLTFATAIVGVNQVLEATLRGVGRPTKILLAQVVGIPATLLSMLLMLPLWGLVGAGIASSIGAVTSCFVLLRVVTTVTAIPLKQLCVPGTQEMRLVISHARRVLRR